MFLALCTRMQEKQSQLSCRYFMQVLPIHHMLHVCQMCKLCWIRIVTHMDVDNTGQSIK